MFIIENMPTQEEIDFMHITNAQAKYYALNREKCTNYLRKYQKEHVLEYQINSKKYYDTHKEIVKEKRRLRYAKQKELNMLNKKN